MVEVCGGAGVLLLVFAVPYLIRVSGECSASIQDWDQHRFDYRSGKLEPERKAPGAWVAPIVVSVIGILTGFISTLTYVVHVKFLINPEYYAIKEILSVLK